MRRATVPPRTANLYNVTKWWKWWRTWGDVRSAERKAATAGTSQCGAATAGDGSRSWTPAIRIRRLHDRPRKNPVPFWGTGLATGGPPVLQARPV